jgi:lipid-A-disaccharide synthase
VSRVYFVAGEASGDTHGANLIRALRMAAPEALCEGLGGPRMAAAGMDLQLNLAEQGIMGFVEVVKHFGMIRRLFKDTVAHIERTRPDCVVVIDYPGFNLQLAKKVHAMGIPVVWYISPQVWAWKKGRIHTIAQVVKKMLVILPFEVEIYRKVGLDCSYVGHPLMDHITATPIENKFDGPCVIGLLPGSREQEIARLMPVMIGVARGIQRSHPEAQFVVPCVDAQRETQIRVLANGFPLTTTIGETYEALHAARFCLVASGTATVETMLHGVPFCILYKVNPATYWLARMLVHIEHIGMVNILAKRTIVPEFIQYEAVVEKVLPVALDLIEEGPQREAMLAELTAVREQIGGSGASAHAAQEILAVIGRGDGDGEAA